MPNKKTLLAAQHGSAFFLQYPHALAAFEERVKAKGIAGIFHESKELLEREWNEKNTAETNQRTTTNAIRELATTLRQTALALEDAVNALLRLEDHEAAVITLARTQNPIADYDDFVRQLDLHTAVVATHVRLTEKVAQFKTELAAYKNHLGEKGDKHVAAETERAGAYLSLEQEQPYLAAAAAAAREWLRHADPTLRDEFFNARHKKTKNSAVAAQSEAALPVTGSAAATTEAKSVIADPAAAKTETPSTVTESAAADNSLAAALIALPQLASRVSGGNIEINGVRTVSSEAISGEFVVVAAELKPADFVAVAEGGFLAEAMNLAVQNVRFEGGRFHFELVLPADDGLNGASVTISSLIEPRKVVARAMVS